MAADYRPAHDLGLCMLFDAQQLYGTATSHSLSPPRSSSVFCLCLSVLPPSNPSALHCLLSRRHPSFILHLFVSICLHLFIHHCRTFCLKRVNIYIYIFFLVPLAVVPRILPHSQPGPERLRILLQDQRAEKEVAGAVWHGHVSVYFPCARAYVHAWRSDKSASFCIGGILPHRQNQKGPARPVIRVQPLDDLWEARNAATRRRAGN